MKASCCLGRQVRKSLLFCRASYKHCVWWCVCVHLISPVFTLLFSPVHMTCSHTAMTSICAHTHADYLGGPVVSAVTSDTLLPLLPLPLTSLLHGLPFGSRNASWVYETVSLSALCSLRLLQRRALRNVSNRLLKSPPALQLLPSFLMTEVNSRPECF